MAKNIKPVMGEKVEDVLTGERYANVETIGGYNPILELKKLINIDACCASPQADNIGYLVTRFKNLIDEYHELNE